MTRSTPHQDEKRPLGGAFSAPCWNLGTRILQPQGRPLIMGILNLTPDSFHAPSRSLNLEAAVQAARAMADAGADLLDLGAESTRPGAEPVTATEEQQRLLPVLEAVRRETDLPLTVDTVRATTAQAALDLGADAVNDISAGNDPAMFELVARRSCGLILMHKQGTPDTMQDDPQYQDVAKEVADWLAARCALAREAGITEDRLVVDPGIGFGKTLAHNLALLAQLKMVAGSRPLLLGASRKSFIGLIASVPDEERLPGSLAALVPAYQAGATMVRVHDVAASVQFLDVLSALNSKQQPS